MTRLLTYAAAACLLALSAWPQPMLPVAPPQGQAAAPQAQTPPPPPLGKVYAMRASGAVPQSPYMDEKLKDIAPVLEPLPFTSYEAISVVENALPWGRETLFPVNAVYAMHVTAQPQEPDGAIPLRARVEMLQGENYVNALDTTAKAAQNQALLFRGMPLSQGELVIVLLIALPRNEDSKSDSSQENQQQSEGEGENQEQQNPDADSGNEGEQNRQEASGAEQEQQETQSGTEEGEGEGEKPEGVQNLDALLESLDDIDRREQVEERNKRDRIDFKGDWW